MTLLHGHFAAGVMACLLGTALAPSSAGAAGPAKKPVLPPAPPGVVIEKDLEYLDPGRAERLDLYRPAQRPDGKTFGGVVVIHGGGWAGGDKAAAREFHTGTTLAKAGYVCVSINYTLEPGKRWPTNLFDCKNAVRFLRKHAATYHVDPNRIGVIGGSAGGHLALMVAYTAGVESLEPQSPYPGISSRVGAVVNMYGITNLVTRRQADPEGNPVGEPRATSGLLTASRTEDPELWRKASPVSHVSKDSPPTLILHGTKDATVERDQATELASRLKEVGATYQIILLPGIGHTFNLETWNRKPLPQDLRPVVVGFFDKHLK